MNFAPKVMHLRTTSMLIARMNIPNANAFQKVGALRVWAGIINAYLALGMLTWA